MVICKNSEDKKSGKREKNLRQKRPRPARAEGGEDRRRQRRNWSESENPG